MTLKGTAITTAVAHGLRVGERLRLPTDSKRVQRIVEHVLSDTTVIVSTRPATEAPLYHTDPNDYRHDTPLPGQWRCDDCGAWNDPEMDDCHSCDTPCDGGRLGRSSSDC